MRRHLFYLMNFFWLSVATALLYYLLIQDTTLHLSITDILNCASRSTKHGHLFIIGFLPIYLGLIIFGAGVLFVYLRASLWPLLSHYLRQWFHFGRNS